jgi:hypothetical protein
MSGGGPDGVPGGREIAPVRRTDRVQASEFKAGQTR